MMPPPGLHIYLWHRMTLTFDLLIPNVDGSTNMHQIPFIRFLNIALTTLATDGRTEQRIGGEQCASACKSDLGKYKKSKVIYDLELT